MGFRLPLDSIPWVKKSEYPHLYEQDPTEARMALPVHAALARQAQHPEDAPPTFCSIHGLVEQRVDLWSQSRTAAQEVRLRSGSATRAGTIRAVDHPHGVVRGGSRRDIARVFMPPQKTLDDYLALVAAVEDTAADMGVPLLVEGYAAAHSIPASM